MKKKVYLSGRISDLPREQYMDYFQKAEELLAKEGFKVINPTKFVMCRHLWLYRLLGYNITLLYDLWRLSKCDNIYKLPGWQQSHGANIESCFAYHMKVWPVPKKVIERTDRKLESIIKKNVKRNNYE